MTTTGSGVAVSVNAPRVRRPPGVSAPPARIVHLGIGAFARAHQAYYTHQANLHHRSDPWGIVGFTGRTNSTARALSEQDGVYYMITRSAAGDRVGRIGSVRTAYSGADLPRLTASLAARGTAVVTMTVTEAGYHLDSERRPALASPVMSADRESLANLVRLDDRAFDAALAKAPLISMPARLVLGLERRRRASAGPLAIVPCDNIAANGNATRTVIAALAHEVSPQLREWIDARVSFVDTSVDRITPATTPQDLDAVTARTGLRDTAAVVTEPFHDWILRGTFPAGRPVWERAGARFVKDITPFEQRKLWLLNGAHSLLAYAGSLAGYRTVAQAIGDHRLRTWIEELWDAAEAELPPDLELDRYRADLLERFTNPRIEHRLSQIAADGTTKLRLRAVPVLDRAHENGRDADAAARVLAAWIAWILASGQDSVQDPAAEEIREARRRSVGDDPRPLLDLIGPQLSDDANLVATTRSMIDQVRQLGPRR
jgi:fructuronate reductase